MNETQVRILVVFANPGGTQALRLGAEDRAIREALYRGSHGNKIEVDFCHAANLHDLRQALLRNSYRIVQFSGHSDASGFLFEDRDGQTQNVSFEVFGSFIRAHSPPIEGVILGVRQTLQVYRNCLRDDPPQMEDPRCGRAGAWAVEHSLT